MTGALLKLDNLRKHFGGLHAVDGVDLAVEDGEVVSIIGPNGAGKTTMFNLITGQLRPTKGRVVLEGNDITDRPPHDRARFGLGRTFQIVRPLEALTVLENVMVGSFLRHRRRQQAQAHAWSVLERVGLGDKAQTEAGSLTMVDRKRLEVAGALATDPVILLLDEVMAGLTPTEADAAVALFRELNDDGLTILLIEHNLRVVRAFSQHVVVLHHGAMLAQGTADDVLSNQEVIDAYIGKRRGEHAS